MKIGVTGGAGFIGSHVVDVLLERGHWPVIFDHRGRPAMMREVMLGDTRDEVAVTELAAHVDGIIHLASVLGTQETVANPRPAVMTNVKSGMNVFEAGVQYNLPVVNICVGNHGFSNPYSASKTCVETLGHMYVRDRGLRLNQVRLVNAYGPRQSVAAPYGCVDPDTLVLRDDLSWAPISSLEPGDALVGLDEYPELGKQRKLRRSVVTGSWGTRKDAVRIEFDDGRSVVCSLDHPWLASSALGQLREWTAARKLAVGDRVVWATSGTWERGLTFDHGYVSGLLDGEGHIGSHGVVFTQNPGPVLSEYLRLMRDFGYSAVARPKESGREVMDVWLTGGLTPRLRVLGEFRPRRLMEQSWRLWDGVAPHGGRATVVEITELGETDLWDIETTTHTYVANGFMSHNSSKVRKIMPSFVCRALVGDPVEVYGDGLQVSDMVWVRDGALALVLALEAAAAGTVVPGVMECGPDEHVSVVQIAELVLAEVAAKIGSVEWDITHLPMRPGETPGAYVTCDPSTLKPIGMTAADLKPLREGVAETVRWYAEHWLPTWRGDRPQQWCLDGRGGDCGWCSPTCKGMS